MCQNNMYHVEDDALSTNETGRGGICSRRKIHTPVHLATATYDQENSNRGKRSFFGLREDCKVIRFDAADVHFPTVSGGEAAD